ncbi:MAG: hypothetical protein IK064_04490, partial [Clostridia bacterium]|nr:hypothetical protein [Clostridia bacterium]
MNRFFRTAFSSTLVYMLMVLIAVVPTGISLPFLSFSCLYLGLLVFMLPVISRKLAGKELLFAVLGAVLALCGFLFLIGRPIVHFVCHGVGLAAVCAFIPLLASNTKHSDFEAKFRFSIIICAAVVFVIFLAGVTETDFFSINKDNVMRALYDLVPVAIVMLATGVLLLRGLRAQQGSVDEKTFNKRQLRDTLIFSGIVSAVFAIDPVRYINKFLSFMTDNVLSPFYSLLKKGLHELYLLLINRNPPPPGGSGYVEPTPEYVDITP